MLWRLGLGGSLFGFQNTTYTILRLALHFRWALRHVSDRNCSVFRTQPIAHEYVLAIHWHGTSATHNNSDKSTHLTLKRRYSHRSAQRCLRKRFYQKILTIPSKTHSPTYSLLDSRYSRTNSRSMGLSYSTAVAKKTPSTAPLRRSPVPAPSPIRFSASAMKSCCATKCRSSISMRACCGNSHHFFHSHMGWSKFWKASRPTMIFWRLVAS